MHRHPNARPRMILSRLTMSADAPQEEADANPLSRRNWGHALRAVGYLFVGLLTMAFLSLVFLVNRRDSLLRVAAWLGRVLPGGGRRAWRRHPRAAQDEESPAFPFAWEKALRKNMGLYARLTPAEQKLL